MEKGPIYGVELIESLPLGGAMLQSMPSRADLERVAERSQRTVAGYEVLLANYYSLLEACKKAVRELNEIRARDGVPYTHQGIKASVCEDYFSSVVDECFAAIKKAGGNA